MTFASWLLALACATTAPPPESAEKGPVLLDFHAEWCGPCKRMRPAVAQLIKKGFPVKSIDVDQSPKLASRYHIEAVPTFIVVDGTGAELDRSTGPQPAADLAQFFNSAAAKARPPANSRAHAGSHQDDSDDADTRSRAARDDDRPEQGAEPAQPAFKNPNPWETVVRIRVLAKHSTGFGSGTIIYSTPEQSLILTCAHIFKLEGRRQEVAPSEFPRRIMIDLFDGNLQGTNPAMVHFLESVEGKAVDYEFQRDVGLIRIRPGRRLPAARIVPTHWQPEARMRVLTVGCSEGQDATAWHTTIERPRIQNFLSGNATYEAIECHHAPKQGRSGGGLFTTDGYVTGVCNFAEPQGNHGLYATPRSIYALLDRNKLSDLYAPPSRGSDTGTLAANSRRPRLDAPNAVTRSQSPDHEESEPVRRRPATASGGEVMIPPPSFVGITEPIPAEPDAAPALAAAAANKRRTNWAPIRKISAPASSEHTEPTDLNLDPAADSDRFGPPTADQPDPAATDSMRLQPGTASSDGTSARHAWRPKKQSESAGVDGASGLPVSPQ
jgi:thiol-disulfide isomerase/thioredoxin